MGKLKTFCTIAAILLAFSLPTFANAQGYGRGYYDRPSYSRPYNGYGYEGHYQQRNYYGGFRGGNFGFRAYPWGVDVYSQPYGYESYRGRNLYRPYGRSW